MSTFEGPVLQQTVAVARAHKIDPCSLLAVVEVESAGKSMDGNYPCLLFERHIFYRECQRSPVKGILAKAVEAGLANKTWQPKTQYKDQGTSAKRIGLFLRAHAIDEECAIRSCSWGVGQTMGFLAQELHFKNAVEMLAYMVSGGVPAQVECMVREIENKRLVPKLNAHNWAGFARVYNGPGYAQNHYDDKMASAYVRWSIRPLPDVNAQPAPPMPPTPPAAHPLPKAVAFGGLAATSTAGIAAAVKTHWEVLAFGGFLAVLALATIIILWRRPAPAQLGTLAAVEGV